MIFLSIDGWGNGLSATLSFLFGFILGIVIVVQARKIKARLLLLMGLNIMIAGLVWVGLTLDFLSILFTGNNLPNPAGLMGIINYIWPPLALLISLYIAAELIIPSKKKIIVVLFLIPSIIFEIFVLVFPLSNFWFEYPVPPGSDLIIIYTNTNSPINLLLIFFQFVGLIFIGFGYLMKSSRSSGVIKNKFRLLAIGYLIYTGVPTFSVLLSRVGFDLPVPPSRFIMASSFLFFYFGLREAPAEKNKKKEIVKEIKLKESLFRLYERPDYITEEEVSFHREKKICLVCKGSVSRINYICPKCSALYCDKCSDQLGDLENMCWVCDEPFDDTKPVRPYKKKKPKEDETLGKTQ